MKGIKRIIISLIIICNSTYCFCQSSTQIPASPNAASLGRYGEIPVGYYTGVPQIDIPLYEISANAFKLPISISYHAGGNRVSEEAGWVGLGMSLNFGGMISRVFKGKDDLETGGTYGMYRWTRGNFLPVPDFDLRNGVQPSADFGMMLNQGGFFYLNNQKINYTEFIHSDERFDNEPDLFYYNFAGYVGKFF